MLYEVYVHCEATSRSSNPWGFHWGTESFMDIAVTHSSSIGLEHICKASKLFSIMDSPSREDQMWFTRICVVYMLDQSLEQVKWLKENTSS